MSEEIENQEVEPQEENIEDLAKEQGWVPLEEYKGPPEKHKSAQEFLEFGERLNPILKKQRDEFRNELKQTKEEIARYKAAVEEITKANAERADAEYKSQITFLKNQLKEARREGNHDVAEQLEETLEDLRDKKPVVQEPPKPASNPAYDDWMAEHKEWIEKDEVMTDYALGAAQKMQNTTQLRGKEFFDELTRKVKSAFPEKFTKRPRVSMVEGGGGGSPRTGGRGTYEGMPADAKVACQEYTKGAKPLMSKEEYVRIYWAGIKEGK